MGLYERITDKNSLKKAWDKIKGNNAAAGIDGITTGDFTSQCEEMITQLYTELHTGQYSPKPAKMVILNKDGKERMISILCMRDKIVQQAICFELDKIFEDTFSDAAYAYRAKRSALQAIDKTEEWIKNGNVSWYLKTDISDFFENIQIDRIIRLLKRRIYDEKLINLVTICLHMKNVDSYGIIHDKIAGVYQGSILAPVLSNIYLTDFDRWLERINNKYIRYSDDILVLGKNKNELEELLGRMSAFLEKQGLELKEAKTYTGSLDSGFTFLGYQFNDKGKTVPAKAQKHLEERLEEYWLKNGMFPVEEKIKKSREIIGGWEQYYKTGKLPANIYEYVVTLSITPEGRRDSLEKVRFKYDNIHKDIMEYMVSYWNKEKNYYSGLCEYEQYYQVINYDREKSLNLPEKTIKELLEQYKLASVNENGDGFVEIMQLYTDSRCYNKASQILEWVKRKEQKEYVMPENPGVNNTEWNGLKLSEAEISQYMELFAGREDMYKQAEVMQNGRLGYETVKQPLTAQQIKEHLSGKQTLATFIQRNNNTVKYMVFDIDITKKALAESNGNTALQAEYQQLALQKAVELQKICQKSGLTTYIEYSGYKGYHVWLFFDEWISVRYVNLLQDAILSKQSGKELCIQIECFPNKTRTGNGNSGPGIKMPWGRHFRSGQYTYFVGEDMELWEKQKDMLNGVARFSISEIKRVIAASTGHNISIKKKTETSLDEFGEIPESIKMVLSHCGLMQYLCGKSKNTGYLSHFERLTVLYVFGHLGKEGKEFVHKIMEYTLNYQYNVTEKYIKRLPEKPVSCVKLREQYKQITAETGCNCNFKRIQGCYPSPVLHVIRDASHIPEGVTVPASRNISPSEEKKIPKELNIHKRAEEITHKMMELRKQERGIKRAIEKQEMELNKILDETGSDSIELEIGMLKRNKVNGRYEWSVEL